MVGLIVEANACLCILSQPYPIHIDSKHQCMTNVHTSIVVVMMVMEGRKGKKEALLSLSLHGSVYSSSSRTIQ